MTTRVITACTITVHDRAPAREELTVEIESDWDGQFVEELKARIPMAQRAWVKDLRRWYVAPAHQEAVCQLARERYGAATLVTDGGRTRVNLHTGQRHEQLSLF